MAQYLRDLSIENLRITEERIRQLHRIFSLREATLNDENNPLLSAVFSCIIRFDNKGYRTYDPDTLIAHYQEATKIERVIFTLVSVNVSPEEAVKMELWLDTRQNANSYFTVESNDNDWVNSSYNTISELIPNYKFWYWWLRTPFTSLIIQLVGVAVIFLASIAIANEVAPNLDIKEPFFLSFLFVLLVLSNFWGYINQWVLGVLSKMLPNIDFKQTDKINWSDKIEKGGYALLGLLGLWIIGTIAKYGLDVIASLTK